MSNSINPIHIALGLGALATIAGLTTLVTGNDDEAEMVAVASEEAAPVKKAPKRQATAGAWGFDEPEGEEGQSEIQDDERPAEDDDGGWGNSSRESPPEPRPQTTNSERSEYTEASTIGERPGPSVPNEAPPGAGERVDGLESD